MSALSEIANALTDDEATIYDACWKLVIAYGNDVDNASDYAVGPDDVERLLRTINRLALASALKPAVVGVRELERLAADWRTSAALSSMAGANDAAVKAVVVCAESLERLINAAAAERKGE